MTITTVTDDTATGRSVGGDRTHHSLLGGCPQPPAHQRDDRSHNRDCPTTTAARERRRLLAADQRIREGADQGLKETEVVSLFRPSSHTLLFDNRPATNLETIR